MNNGRARYVWDYDLTQEQFDAMLAGEYEDGHLNRDWAAERLQGVGGKLAALAEAVALGAAEAVF